MNKLFEEIPFSQEDEVHEHNQMSWSLGRRKNRKSLLLFSLVFAGFRKELSAENLPFQREGMAKQGRLNQ